MKLLSNINLNIKNIELKKLFNKHNAKILTKIVVILLLLWCILYIIPEFFVFLFNTILGKIILLLIVVIISIYNYKHGLLLASILVIIYRSYILSNAQLTNAKEGFTWTQEQVDEFIRFQDSASPQIVYNTKQLQKYASPSEVDNFLKNGFWPWSDATQQLYIQYLLKNPYVRIYKTNGLDSARKVYNESAILYILKGQEQQIEEEKTKENNELPSGWGTFGYNSGLL
jgi:uncharacterized membrane protein YcgQ (UPF0703/DUF1980 family)